MKNQRNFERVWRLSLENQIPLSELRRLDQVCSAQTRKSALHHILVSHWLLRRLYVCEFNDRQ